MLSLTGVRQNAVKKFHFWKKKNQNTRISTFCLLLYARLLRNLMAGGRNTKSILAVAIKRFKTSQSVVFAFLQQHRRRLLLTQILRQALLRCSLIG